MATTIPDQLAPLPRRAAPVPPDRERRLRARWGVLGPGAVVGLMVALVVSSGLAASHGDPSGFVHFGRVFAAVIHPPRGAILATPSGYDGQYFWSLATDPLLLHPSTIGAFATQGFRLQRIAYPALVDLLAAGRPAGVLWALLAVNVVTVIGATVLFAGYARRRGWSGWWGLALGLLPGLMYALLGDLSDGLAVATMLGGLVAFRHDRRWTAGVLLAVAGLAREPMMLAVLAVAVQNAVVARSRARLQVIELRRAVREAAWTPVLVPALAFSAWQLYIRVRGGGAISAPGSAFAAPFTQLGAELHHALHAASAVDGAWDILYLTAMVTGMALAAAHARRGPSAPAVAALLFALVLPVLTFGDAWSYTRLSAPLFACLLLAGLERRARGTLLICAAVAALGALVPLSIG